jgi:hypothetical protein
MVVNLSQCTSFASSGFLEGPEPLVIGGQLSLENTQITEKIMHVVLHSVSLLLVGIVGDGIVVLPDIHVRLGI